MPTPWLVTRPAGSSPLRLRWRILPAPPNLDPPTLFDRLFPRSSDAVFLDSSSSFPDATPRFLMAKPTHEAGFSARFYVASDSPNEVPNKQDFYGFLRDQLTRIQVPEDFPRELTGGFTLGWVGAFGYELKNLSADVRSSATAVREPWQHPTHPDAALVFADQGLVYDPTRGTVVALALEPVTGNDEPGTRGKENEQAPRSGETGSDAWFAQVTGIVNHLASDDSGEEAAARKESVPGESVAGHAVAKESVPGSVPGGEYRLAHGHQQYLDNVRAVQQHIADGDTYEVCLTTTATGPALVDPWASYLQLRRTSPVPYGAYLRFSEEGVEGLASGKKDEIHVLSASPERFLRIRRNDNGGLTVDAKPIKGTRPRGVGTEDQRLRTELQTSPKDRAENLMIVDLLRNDLSKVCEPGSVRVTRLFDVESYSHVHQLVSTIEGELAEAGAGDAITCLAACFPGGSMTGAPKVRTMELLEDLEGRARGLYSGAIGWLSPTGEADLSIVIRTLIDDANSSSFGIGGAIVTDSNPEEEWQEILVKASALLDALGATLRN